VRNTLWPQQRRWRPSLGQHRRAWHAPGVKAADVRGFLDRDWARVAESKACYFEARKRALGAAYGMRVSDELRRQVLAMRPGWPDAADRAADLEAHARLSRRLMHGSAPSAR
jgi:hypothetical protein